jgi:hypothetical protein
MNNQIEIVKKDNYLHVTVSGIFSPELSEDSIDNMVAAAKKDEFTKILFDIRPMSGEIGVLDRFESGRYGALIIPQNFKIAMLGRNDQISPDKFFQTVVRNRGVNLKVFSEFEKAIEWLMR